MEERRTVRDGYDTLAETYADRRTLTGRGTELVEAFAASIDPDSRVLDAGCGGGVPAGVVLADRHSVLGCDISGAQLAAFEANVPGGDPVYGDLTTLPVADGSVDAVVSLFAVIHVPRERHDEVFTELHRVLGSDGEALLVVGNEPWEGRNPDWLDAGAEMFWSYFGRDRNLGLLRDAGFEIIDDEVVSDELGGAFCFVRVQT
ncbi:MAG: class I SAM-dependent methyltransferase [Halobacteriales archaeon]|nr:class I SAM-dependent methyltransferase [Halobacteriales archaeon]